MLLKERTDIVLRDVLKFIDGIKPIDKDRLFALTKDHLSNHNGGRVSDMNYMYSLEEDWYKKLRGEGIAPYYLYGDDRYIAEAMYCYFQYSRKYIMNIINPKSYKDSEVFKDVMRAKKIIDLGAGFGLTSIGLKQGFGDVEVIGTNIKDTLQFKVMGEYANVYGLRVVEDVNGVGVCDVVFASEYFEHFEKPIEHLRYVVRNVRPKYMFIANTFSQDAVGHFDVYDVNGAKIDGMNMGRIFNKMLVRLGYEKIKTNMWNNRPGLFRDVRRRGE